MRPLKVFGIFEDHKRKLYTESLIDTKSFQDDIIVKENNTLYRYWNPRSSKLGAYLYKGARDIFVREGGKVLYLGVASGTTASHISDIVGRNGMVFGVDPAFRPLTKFFFLAKERTNFSPILADASDPASYEHLVPQVDLIVQDIAQRHQTLILRRNMDKFLKKGGFAILSIKARSIDVGQKPSVIFKRVRRDLERDYTVVDSRSIEPYERDHSILVLKK